MGFDPGEGCDESLERSRHGENRHLGPGRYSVGRAFARPCVPGGRRAGYRQDHDGAAVPDGRRPRGRKVPVHHALGNRRELREALPRTAGRWATKSRSSNWCRPRACSIPSSSRACCIRRTSSRRNHQADFEAVERVKPSAWCSTACPKSGCWRRVRCATGGRFSRSSITLQNSTPPSCCSTT